MAQIINLQTVEKLIFLNAELRKMLPDFTELFQEWGIAYQAGNRVAAQQVLISFLAALKGEHLQTMRGYFNDVVILHSVNPDITKHVEITIDKAKQVLESQTAFRNMLCAYREGDQLYLSFMR